MMNDAVDLSLVLNKSEEEKARQLPIPKGYKILVTLPDIDEEFESGIIKPSQVVYHEQLYRMSFS